MSRIYSQGIDAIAGAGGIGGGSVVNLFSFRNRFALCGMSLSRGDSEARVRMRLLRGVAYMNQAAPIPVAVDGGNTISWDGTADNSIRANADTSVASILAGWQWDYTNFLEWWPHPYRRPVFLPGQSLMLHFPAQLGASITVSGFVMLEAT